MLEIFKKIYRLLSPKERKAALLLLLQMITSSLISTFGIALIFPFMSIIVNPALISQQRNIAILYKLMHFKNTHHFFIFLGIFLLLTVILGNVFAALNAWSSTRFSLLRNRSFSERLLEKYLYQPYAFYLDKNSSILSKNIMVEVYSVIQNIMLGTMHIIEQLVLVIMIVLLLIVVNPLVSMLILLILSGVYAGIYFLVKNTLTKISRKTVFSRDLMAKTISEGFGGIKYIKFLHKEKNIIDNYSQNAKIFAEHVATANAIGLVPRYVLETVAFGGLILLLLYYLMHDASISKLIPLVALYAFAAYRLMPSFQQLFFCVTQIQANKHSLDVIYDDIVHLPFLVQCRQHDLVLSLKDFFCLENVSFLYPNAFKPAVKQVKIAIKANTTVGFVGATGAGKTTLIDIILGFYEPMQGHLIVDGVMLHKGNIRSWQNNLGYVPQHIYLSDDTVANNIAFGLSAREIDMQSVKVAAARANLSAFIEKELPQGYETVIGERGIRLSGGQMQRLGIARALYGDPQVLILDEATSSLDGITEDVILQAVKKIENKKTIIMIAHRLSTVRECAQIFFMKNGRVTDVGTYDELLQRNNEFRKMAKQK